MNKRVIAIFFLAAVFAISIGYDFYRGYHESGSITGGIASVLFGLIILAILGWLFFSRRKSN
jgi:LPXTG-motif cell wall-anchored protein